MMRVEIELVIERFVAMTEFLRVQGQREEMVSFLDGELQLLELLGSACRWKTFVRAPAIIIDVFGNGTFQQWVRAVWGVPTASVEYLCDYIAATNPRQRFQPCREFCDYRLRPAIGYLFFF